MDARSDIVEANSPERELKIVRIFDAPRELGFKCWSEPEHLGRWSGSKGFTSTILTLNCTRAEFITFSCAGWTVGSFGSRECFLKSFRQSDSSGSIDG